MPLLHTHQLSENYARLLPVAAGPSYAMLGVPAREQLHREVANKSAAAVKARTATAAATPLQRAMHKLGGTTDQPVDRLGANQGTGGRSSSATPAAGRTPLSAAGRKLVSSLKGKSMDGSDIQLRASYTHTPKGMLMICTGYLTPV